jgi:hypothetical protein
MKPVLVKKTLTDRDGYDAVMEYEVEVAQDGTAYLKAGEEVVSNPDNANIHLPSQHSSIKLASLTVIAIGILALIAVAVLSNFSVQ